MPTRKLEASKSQKNKENKLPRKSKQTAMPAVSQKGAPSRRLDRKSKEWAEYLQALVKEVRSYIVYPPAAKRRAWEGEVQLGLDLDKSGRVLGLKLLSRSKHEVLNEATLKSLKQIKKLKPLPHGLGEESIHIKIPISFRLQKR